MIDESLSRKNIIESTNTNQNDIMVCMSRTIKKYQLRNKRDKYKRVEKLKLDAKYYTDVAKSHERNIERKGLQPDEPESKS